MEAIEASVFALDGKLMVAGHQFVRIYSIRGEVPEIPYTFSISPPQRGVFLCPHLTTFPSPSRLTVLPPRPSCTPPVSGGNENIFPTTA